jgi:hypothetical protein
MILPLWKVIVLMAAPLIVATGAMQFFVWLRGAGEMKKGWDIAVSHPFLEGEVTELTVRPAEGPEHRWEEPPEHC